MGSRVARCASYFRYNAKLLSSRSIKLSGKQRDLEQRSGERYSNLTRLRAGNVSANNERETMMKVLSRAVSRNDYVFCPFCESGELVLLEQGFARCNSCGLPLFGSSLQTLQDIVGLPDALGAHSCECGHPEMRELPMEYFTAQYAGRR